MDAQAVHPGIADADQSPPPSRHVGAQHGHPPATPTAALARLQAVPTGRAAPPALVAPAPGGRDRGCIARTPRQRPAGPSLRTRRARQRISARQCAHIDRCRSTARNRRAAWSNLMERWLTPRLTNEVRHAAGRDDHQPRVAVPAGSHGPRLQAGEVGGLGGRLKQCRPCVAQVTSKPWIMNDEGLAGMMRAWLAPKLTAPHGP